MSLAFDVITGMDFSATLVTVPGLRVEYTTPPEHWEGDVVPPAVVVHVLVASVGVPNVTPPGAAVATHDEPPLPPHFVFVVPPEPAAHPPPPPPAADPLSEPLEPFAATGVPVSLPFVPPARPPESGLPFA